ncbi:hypothetical protein IM697_00455 [Streptomyces ferrugineus]|uniref:Lipoprotein n=1 Tax=Streptomyces ferrugineus TaxID=1413221 RepID=A0A7M2SL36_9ACTN|nr:hypothetical protein [Streptomyces ferrugineus]QOV36984.1 hypothetical protein IM697_00455 [Streptomyces ferrugineus]
MPRPPARAVVASAFSAGVVLTASACSSVAGLGTVGPGLRASASSASPGAASHAPVAAPTLTEAQARAALISEDDLGEPWVPTEGFATWRETMLKARTESRACGRLLDALYAEDLFGPDASTRASIGLDDAWDGAQMRYQIVAHRPEDVDRTLAWLGGLPDECGRFTATARGGQLAVEVTEAPMPRVGDAGQALRIVLSGISEYGDAPTLTLDVAAVRVGDDAITVTNGGLGEVSADATWTAVELGAHRLAEARKQGRRTI